MQDNSVVDEGYLGEAVVTLGFETLYIPSSCRIVSDRVLIRPYHQGQIF